MGWEHIQTTENQADLVLLYGLLGVHRETSRVSGPEPEMGACSNRRSSSDVLCSRSAAHLLVCEAPLYTQTHAESETVPWPETRRTCLKLFAWKVPEFSVLVLPHQNLSLFFHWAHVITSTRTFPPCSFQTMKKNSFFSKSFLFCDHFLKIICVRMHSDSV